MAFRERHLAIGVDKRVDGPYIFICTDTTPRTVGERTEAAAWTKFYVRTNMGPKAEDGRIEFWAGMGRDALYEALVMFVWIIRGRKDAPWMLDQTNLKNEEIGLNRIFRDDN
jgi:hypothetical protein